jgi:hypothetical protein
MSATIAAFGGFLLAFGAGFNWFRAMHGVRLPTNRGAFLAAFVAASGLGISALVAGEGWVVGVPAVLSIIAGALFMLTFAISRQEVAADAIRVGEILPAFTALDENGAMFNAASLRGHPVLIKFFRGHW